MMSKSKFLILLLGSLNPVNAAAYCENPLTAKTDEEQVFKKLEGAKIPKDFIGLFTGLSRCMATHDFRKKEEAELLPKYVNTPKTAFYRATLKSKTWAPYSNRYHSEILEFLTRAKQEGGADWARETVQFLTRLEPNPNELDHLESSQEQEESELPTQCSVDLDDQGFHLVHRYQLLPEGDHIVQVRRPKSVFYPKAMEDILYSLGRPFDVGEDRIGILYYVIVGDQKYLRAAYTSKSQSVARAFTALNIGIPGAPLFDKGLGEHYLTLPWEFQKAFAKILDQYPVTRIPHDEWIPLDREISENNQKAIQVVGYCVPISSRPEDVAHRKIRLTLSFSLIHKSKLIKNTGQERRILTIKGTSSVMAPEQVAFLDPLKRPNYSKILDTYSIQNSLAGRVEVSVYPSHDESIEYLVMKDSENQIWFGGAISKGSPVNTFGAPVEMVDLGELAMPLWEYSEYCIQGNVGETNSADSRYSLNRYLRKIGEIRSYYSYMATKNSSQPPASK